MGKQGCESFSAAVAISPLPVVSNVYFLGLDDDLLVDSRD
jgi:hypothetical protein